MSLSLRDAQGIELKRGQKVAVAVRSGNVAVIRIALVKEVHEDEKKVSIAWTDSPGMSKISVSGQYVKRHRMVIIN